MSFHPSSEPVIDRIAPTLPPADRPVMRQRWAKLLFLHWKAPAPLLQALLPPGLTLDTFDGEAYVGLVPFTMTGVRPVWSPSVPGLSNFHETNVRTYVHCGGRDPGVWFFSLDAANPVAVALARWFYRLPYYLARMRLAEQLLTGAEDASTPGAGGHRVEYNTKRLFPGPLLRGCAVSYSPTGEPAPAEPGTLTHFLVERYILYAFHRGSLYQGRVHHAPYPVQSASLHSLNEDLLEAAGIPRPGTPPLIHYASEVGVKFYPLRKV